MLGDNALLAIALIGLAIGLAACGNGDDDDTTTTTTTGSAAAPSPDTAFKALTTALEGQGLAVTSLPKSSLDGAESGINVSGDQAGTVRLFATEQEADAYAKRVERAGDATVTVGTVVFEAGSQEDADFIRSAYAD